MNYDQQGTGEPLHPHSLFGRRLRLLCLPGSRLRQALYLHLASTCAGQVKADKPEGVYSSELFADDVAAFMQAIGIPKAHVSGLSLGAATGMWLAAKYPDKVKSLSLHSGWPKTDLFLKTVVEGWQVMAKALGSVPEMVILGIFPWCFTPELYAARPDYIQALSDFVRGRPVQPLAAFIQESNAVIAHDAEAQLGRITAPTQITFGRHDSDDVHPFCGSDEGQLFAAPSC